MITCLQSTPVSASCLTPSYVNSEVTRSYTASCPAGSTGSDVTRSVTIGIGIYSSTISSEVATEYAAAAALEQAREEAIAALSCVYPSVPVAPTGLATDEFEPTLDLKWNASTGATSYTLKRGTSSGFYPLVITGLTSTHYSDSTALEGVTYHYVVAAVNATGSSADSTEVFATLVKPTAYLKFDEGTGTTASDFSGHGVTGTLVNGATWGSGHPNNAVSLDGVNDYVSLPSGIFSALTTLTVALWANVTVEGTWSRLFDFGRNATVNMFLTAKASPAVVRFAITLGGNPAEQRISGSSPFPTGGWHHVAVTLNGATGTLYVDGVQVAQNTSMTLNPSSLGSTTQNWLGRSQYVADPYLGGKIDEFRLYSHALSSVQIAKLVSVSPLIP